MELSHGDNAEIKQKADAWQVAIALLINDRFLIR